MFLVCLLKFSLVSQAREENNSITGAGDERDYFIKFEMILFIWLK